jgi:hypothetical protein
MLNGVIIRQMPSEYTLDSVETLSYAEKVGVSEEGRKKNRK